MNKILTYLILLILVVSCKPKLTFISGLDLGAPESLWRQQIARLETDSTARPKVFLDDTAYLYKWAVNDTTLSVNFRINNDRIAAGSLRVLSLDLATAYTEKRDPADLGDRLPGDPLFEQGASFNGYYCTERTYQLVRQHLETSFGKPDSTSTFDGGYIRDSSIWFKADEYDVELRFSPLNRRIKSVGIPLYTSATLNVYKKGYAQELAVLEEAHQKNLKPSDLVEISFEEPKITEQRNGNGTIMPALLLQSWKEGALSYWLEKPVESVKGDLIIQDRFGEALYTWTGFEYKPDEPIKPSGVRQLTQGKSWYMFLLNKPELAKLKEAIALQRELGVRFVPTDIYYTDGTVLR